MAYTNRKTIISSLQKLRGSKIISYVMNDRPTSRIQIPGMGIGLNSEPQLFIIEQLMAMGKVKTIDLFLYTRGGEVDSVLPLVNAIREFCDEFNVLIPFRAHSGGTLICLGADQIIMGPFGELTPIDPTTGNQFSPVDELNPRARKGISVEDVTSYMSLAKNDAKVGIKDESNVLEVFRTLSQQVHPLALGHVNRVQTHIRTLAEELLKLGNKRNLSAEKTKLIVNTLTEKVTSHTHAIDRHQAQKLLGTDILKFTSDEEEKMVWSLFDDYANTMLLKEKFNIRQFMGDTPVKELSVCGAFVETEHISQVYECISSITQRSDLPPNYQVQIQAGQNIPFIPGFPRQNIIELVWEGWKNNEGGE